MKTIATQETLKDSSRSKKFNAKTQLNWRVYNSSSLSTGMPSLQRKCACGGGCPRCKDNLGIQTKLKIGEPADKYEQEANRIADEVMRMPEPSVQRQTELDEKEVNLNSPAPSEPNGETAIVDPQAWVNAPHESRYGPPPPGVSPWDAQGTTKTTDPKTINEIESGQACPNAGIYRTPRRAARAFLNAHNPKSVSLDREAMGYILKLDKRQFTYTKAVWSGLPYYRKNYNFRPGSYSKKWMRDKRVFIPKPPPSAIATVHTHGAATENTTGNFSPEDYGGFESLLSNGNDIQRHFLGLPEFPQDKDNLLFSGGQMKEARLVKQPRPQRNPFSYWQRHKPQTITYKDEQGNWRTNSYTWEEKFLRGRIKTK